MINFFINDKASQQVKEITKGFEIIDLSKEVLDNSFDDNRFDDVEDPIQFHSCISVAGILVIRNKRDYSAVPEEIEMLPPGTF